MYEVILSVDFEVLRNSNQPLSHILYWTNLTSLIMAEYEPFVVGSETELF